MERVSERCKIAGKSFLIREARLSDAKAIQGLFNTIYQGKYPLEFGTDVGVLKAEIADPERFLWIVTEEARGHKLVGALTFAVDLKNRMSKAGGGVVLPEHRKSGLASRMLKLGLRHLTDQAKTVDVLYATSRTVSEGPSRLAAEAGFRKLGFFPNAVQIEEMEHLNLDVFLTKRAMGLRRWKPFLVAPFFDIHAIARKQLGLETATLVTPRAVLKLAPKKIRFDTVRDEKTVVEKFKLYKEQKRIFNSFFPFHTPNMLLSSEDRGSDVFVWYGGVGKTAYLLGIRTDLVNLHDLYDSAALALHGEGAAYIELLVDAYDYQTQQEAYTAKFIPSAYFPAMKLAHDGLRDDFFVVSRTFQILDFTTSCVMAENYPYLKAYMRFYNKLFIEPMRRADFGRKPGA
jgi:RimJ/RimL family protein N-acetyltransferase